MSVYLKIIVISFFMFSVFIVFQIFVGPGHHGSLFFSFDLPQGQHKFRAIDTSERDTPSPHCFSPITRRHTLPLSLFSSSYGNVYLLYTQRQCSLCSVLSIIYWTGLKSADAQLWMVCNLSALISSNIQVFNREVSCILVIISKCKKESCLLREMFLFNKASSYRYNRTNEEPLKHIRGKISEGNLR